VIVAPAVVVVAWSVTGEVNASNRSLDIGQALVDTQPRPLDWIDQATGGADTVYVGQALLRSPEILSLGFWNQSLRRLVTLGGAPVYGLIFETRASADGRLSDPARAEYVVSDQEVDVAGERVASAKRWRLARVDGPVDVNAFETGIWQDGWQEETSSYTRLKGGFRGGRVRVTLSRCSPDPSAKAEVRMVPLARQSGGVVRRAVLRPCIKEPVVVTVPVPRAPFAVRTSITPTFVPAAVSGSADTRHLGALVTYKYLPDGPPLIAP
jgi:hypothetical protein